MKMLKNEKRIEEIARLLYDPSLPYHNFDHALETIANSEVIIENCEKEKIPVDKRVVYYALLFHDAGYHDDHLEKGFETKELYSAHLAEEALKQIGESVDTIKAISHTIIATRKDESFNTIEDRIARVSDLMGLATNYETFKSNSEKLRREKEILTGKTVSLIDWKKEVKENVEFYLSQDIKITQAYWNKNEQSDFHTKAKENISLLLAENN